MDDVGGRRWVLGRICRCFLPREYRITYVEIEFKIHASS